MKTEILKMLAATDGYISGQALSSYFKVSRTAVWKAVKQLKEEGYPIEAVRNRGYRLIKEELQPLKEIYSKTSLESALPEEWPVKSLEFFTSTDSTNTRLRHMAEEGTPEGTLVVADEQNAGKGRRGRNWVSEPGMGVWMSFLLKPDFDPSRASMTALVAALAAVDGIYNVTGLECEIKWPNDVIYQGRKLCGILTEMSTDMDEILYIIVGMGINVADCEFPEDIRDTAASVESCLGKPVSRVKLIAAILSSWVKFYKVFLTTADMSKLKDEYMQKLVNVGKQVKILSDKGSYVGVSSGINSMGELLVETPDGKQQRITSGEVSVRGVYGYV